MRRGLWAVVCVLAVLCAVCASAKRTADPKECEGVFFTFCIVSLRPPHETRGALCVVCCVLCVFCVVPCVCVWKLCAVCVVFGVCV